MNKNHSLLVEKYRPINLENYVGNEHIKKTINPNIKHHIFDITFEDALKVIPNVIKTIETYDITTIRASTPMYLMARAIKDAIMPVAVVRKLFATSPFLLRPISTIAL